MKFRHFILATGSCLFALLNILIIDVGRVNAEGMAFQTVGTLKHRDDKVYSRGAPWGEAENERGRPWGDPYTGSQTSGGAR